MKLNGKIAIVGGASRGAARGIATVLGEQGATVYVVARTSRSGPKPADGAPGTVEDTADEVNKRGGVGIAVQADLSNESDVKALFDRVEREHGRLDVLANSAWAADFMTEWMNPFWNLTSQIWIDTLTTIGAYWWSTVYAARTMARQKSGLIVHVTDNPPGDPHGYRGQILHDVGHEYLNRLIHGAGVEARKAGFAVMGLNPGFMRTERVLMAMKDDKVKKQFRFDLSETVEYIGRAVAALAADPKAVKKSGQLLWVCDLAKEYGFTDVDGRYIPMFDPKAPMQPFPC